MQSWGEMSGANQSGDIALIELGIGRLACAEVALDPGQVQVE